MDRHLREDRLTETAERLSRRVAEAFPDSGLSQVAAEILNVLRDAFARAERIRRPNWALRAGYALLAALAVTAALVAWRVQAAEKPVSLFQLVLNLLDETKGVAVYLTGFALFLFTLETRLKRRRALRAIHELRALAHIVDMHQLSKVPDRVGRPGGPAFHSGKLMSAADVGQYLRFCTELLALVSKVGQLYVQDFLDGVTLAAVDQFENLATGLSGKIWQKIMILDTAPPAPAQAAPVPANSPAVA
jgi:hypothetical protein